jgi:hypothetical protein
MCGLGDPACPRPDYCEECLPRDRKHLHELIRVRCDPAWYGLADKPPRALAALLAAVELCAANQAEALDGTMIDVDTLRPSHLLDVIADELGVRGRRPRPQPDITTTIDLGTEGGGHGTRKPCTV